VCVSRASPPIRTADKIGPLKDLRTIHQCWPSFETARVNKRLQATLIPKTNDRHGRDTVVFREQLLAFGVLDRNTDLALRRCRVWGRGSRRLFLCAGADLLPLQMCFGVRSRRRGHLQRRACLHRTRRLLRVRSQLRLEPVSRKPILPGIDVRVGRVFGDDAVPHTRPLLRPHDSKMPASKRRVCDARGLSADARSSGPGGM
jgi:hypothetical protein